MAVHTLLTIYPVVLRVPLRHRGLTGKKKQSFLSAFARKAIFRSAQKSRITLGKIAKNEGGVPIPHSGYYWSLSHKTNFVAGVVASGPVGIDIERIRPVSTGLYRKTGKPEEWALGGEQTPYLFFRYWTAKEAVLKAAGVGLRGMSACRVVQNVNDSMLRLAYEGQNWTVAQHVAEAHLVSVVKNDWQVEWPSDGAVDV